MDNIITAQLEFFKEYKSKIGSCLFKIWQAKFFSSVEW